MTYHPNPRNRFVTVRLQPSGETVSLEVHRLKKRHQGRWYASQEYVEYGGEKHLVPEHWAELAHVWEIWEASAS